MTSLAALIDWLVADRAAGRRRREGDFRLRALPKEEIHLWVKEIDNSRAIRLVDKKDWWRSLGMACGVMMASVLLIALLLPSAYGLLASKRMQDLESHRQALVNQLRELRVREARLTRPENLRQWAGDRFIDPPASSVVYAPPARGTVASLRTE
jgi:hypothetical protein